MWGGGWVFDEEEDGCGEFYFLFISNLFILIVIVFVFFWCIHLFFVLILFEQIELQAMLLNYFLGSNKSNINQFIVYSILHFYFSGTDLFVLTLCSRISFSHFLFLRHRI